VRFIKVKVTEGGYGFFPGGDPRQFHPDSEGQTEEEAAKHKAACAAWDAGKTTSEPDGVCIPGVGFIDRCQFGLGSYEWTEEVWVWTWVRWVWWPSFTGRLWRWWEWTAKPALRIKP
jgi:hypothetical protein